VGSLGQLKVCRPRARENWSKVTATQPSMLQSCAIPAMILRLRARAPSLLIHLYGRVSWRSVPLTFHPKDARLSKIELTLDPSGCLDGKSLL
jgi:hypothetical protein